MKSIRTKRHGILLLPEAGRVIIRSFIPSGEHRIAAIIGRALALTEEEVDSELARLGEEFASRHFDLDGLLEQHYRKILPHVYTQKELSRERRLLLGALFSGEYALESAALFNPSIVPHPDQTNLPAGALRFIMSLRATGEGHISSIEFRAGVIDPDGSVNIDSTSRFVTAPEIHPNPSYRKKSFAHKLREMGFDNSYTEEVLGKLGDSFNREELERRIESLRQSNPPEQREMLRTIECISWLADSNYELRFSPRIAVSERIIFPVSPNESNGIEDARFVRFVEDDGSVMYYATYTAYNGRAILPQLIETQDFLNFRVLTLNGSAVQDKGMALFPRRVNGNYAMLSRQDDENILIMFSDNPHFWNDPQVLLRPAAPWESVKIGNCGSPIETREGWLVLTHGVGPMRKYCIGAALLDLNDPTKVIGRLREPLLSAEGNEREGYVPNVVYSCGSLLHDGKVILPYAMSDKATAIISFPLGDILEELKTP